MLLLSYVFIKIRVFPPPIVKKLTAYTQHIIIHLKIKKKDKITLNLKILVHKGKKYYFTECPEIGTILQGKTIEQAIENLKEATELYLE